MLTTAKLATIDQDETPSTITALTHSQLQKLLGQDTIQLEPFDENNIVEVPDPEDPKLRYCLCKNPVSTYKSPGEAERAFRNLKTAMLEMRPVYHKEDEPIRAHVFLCMLAYYVQWHMHKALAPLYQGDGEGGERA